MPSPAFVQTFVQTPAGGERTKRASGSIQVLDRFLLEQTGNQLRIIDADGSSYTGKVESAAAVTGDRDNLPQASRLPELKATDRLASQQTSAGTLWNYQAGQNYFFRVSGTNRTRQQLVVFEGNLAVPTNLTTSQLPYRAQPATRGQVAPQQVSSPMLLNSTITGKVRLGTEQEMRINAQPVPP